MIHCYVSDLVILERLNDNLMYPQTFDPYDGSTSDQVVKIYKASSSYSRHICRRLTIDLFVYLRVNSIQFMDL